MQQSVAQLLPFLREAAFCVGFFSGAVCVLLGAIFWRL